MDRAKRPAWYASIPLRSPPPELEGYVRLRKVSGEDREQGPDRWEDTGQITTIIRVV